MTQFRTALLFCVLTVVLAACTGSLASEAPPTPDTPASPPATAGPTLDAAKPLPPLDVRLEHTPATLSIGTLFTATTTITAQAPAPRVTSRIEATGIVMLEQDATGHWQDLSPQQSVVTRIQARLTGCGEGAMRVTVEVADEAGQHRYARSAVVYVLAVDNAVLTGAAGPMLLRLELLDQQQRAGTLTPAEYEHARDRILGGGAQQSGDLTPTATPLPDPCSLR